MHPLLAHIGFGGVNAPATTSSQVNSQQIHSYSRSQTTLVIVVLLVVIVVVASVSIWQLSRGRRS